MATRRFDSRLRHTGLVGTVGVTVLDEAGVVLAARTTSGITEIGTTGAYWILLTIDPAWPLAIVVRWDAGPIDVEARYDLTAYATAEQVSGISGQVDTVESKVDTAIDEAQAATQAALDAESAADDARDMAEQARDAAEGIDLGGMDGFGPLLSQILDQLQRDPPTQTGRQQYRARTIVAGDTYGVTARRFTVVRHRSAEWPLDLSAWTWALVSVSPAGATGGTLAGTVTIGIAEGDARSLEVAISRATTAAAAIGRHGYAIVGTRAGEEITVEKGIADVVARLSPAQ